MGDSRELKLKFIEFVMVGKTAGGVLHIHSGINLCIIYFLSSFVSPELCIANASVG